MGVRARRFVSRRRLRRKEIREEKMARSQLPDVRTASRCRLWGPISGLALSKGGPGMDGREKKRRRGNREEMSPTAAE